MVFVLLKWALRLLYFAETNDYACPIHFFCQCKILSLQALHYESVRSLTYDVYRNSAPENIELFSRISSVHTYNTSTFEHFYTKESRLKVKRNAFLRVGVKIWNRIPQILKKIAEKTFKKSLKATLLDILQNEDS